MAEFGEARTISHLTNNLSDLIKVIITLTQLLVFGFRKG